MWWKKRSGTSITKKCFFERFIWSGCSSSNVVDFSRPDWVGALFVPTSSGPADKNILHKRGNFFL